MIVRYYVKKYVKKSPSSLYNLAPPSWHPLPPQKLPSSLLKVVRPILGGIQNLPSLTYVVLDMLRHRFLLK